MGFPAREKLEAATRLEEAMHLAAERGQPMPISGSLAAPAFAQAQPQYGPYDCVQPGFCRPSAPVYNQYDSSMQYSQGSMGYGGPQYACASEPYAAAGPTLLQSQHQNQGMSTGGKVALAAAGGVAAGVAGYEIATHMDEIGGAFGHAAEGVGHFAAGAVEDVGDFVEGVGGAFGDAAGGVGHFAAGAVEDVGEFVEDTFL